MWQSTSINIISFISKRLWNLGIRVTWSAVTVRTEAWSEDFSKILWFFNFTVLWLLFCARPLTFRFQPIPNPNSRCWLTVWKLAESDRGEIRTRATEVTGALNQRLRPLGHPTMLTKESLVGVLARVRHSQWLENNFLKDFKKLYNSRRQLLTSWRLQIPALRFVLTWWCVAYTRLDERAPVSDQQPL